MFIYKVVGRQVETFDSVEDLLAKYKQVGVVQGEGRRIELQGQPKIEGHLGAMYDGMEGNKHVIRYETQEAYDRLSQ